MSKEKDSGGLLVTLLIVLFIGLKLGGIIDWSWWWVLSPIWISILFAFLVIGIVLLIAKFKNK